MQTDEYARMRDLEDDYWWFVARRNLALDWLHNVAPKGSKVLDVGCGTGAFLQSSQNDFSAYGVDFSLHALKFSSGRGLPQLATGDAQALPFQSESFDAVVSLDTVEHVPRDAEAVAEIFRVLKPGGAFVINVPAFMFLWGPHDVALMHFRRYTKSSVASLLERAGFEVERVNYSVFWLFPVVVARRVTERFHRGPAEVRLPSVPAGLNKVLTKLMESEGRVGQRVHYPWGSSVVAIARKPANP